MENVSKKELLEAVFSVIPKKKVAELVFYGSNNIGSDLDVFAVIHGNCLYGSVSFGKIDVTFVGSIWLSTLIQNLDPIVIEPILTGERIYGRELLPSKSEIKKRKGTINAADFLLQCSDICLAWAREHLAKERLKDSATCLVFSISYLLFAERYSLRQRVITFKNLRKQVKCRNLDEALAFYKGKRTPKLLELLNLIKSTRQSLTKTYNRLIAFPRLKKGREKPE